MSDKAYEPDEADYAYVLGKQHGREEAAAQLAAKDKEIAELKHDLGNYMTIANTEANEVEQLRVTIARLREALTNAKNWCPNCRGVGYHLWSEWVNDVGDFVERKSDCHTCAPIRAALTEEQG